MMEKTRILAVCGIVNRCEKLVHQAATLALAMKAELFILTVIYNPFGVKGLSLPRPSLQRDFDALVRKLRKDMQAIINREKGQGLEIHHMIREGKPEKEIIAVVGELQAQLLIVPAHRQTRLEHFLSGGYNKTLLRKMPCSVLFLKSEPSAVEEEEEQEEEWPIPASATTGRSG